MKSKYSILAIFLLYGITTFGQNKPEVDYFKGSELFSTVQKFVSLGEHRTGTPTDLATSDWLGKELVSYGYDVKYLEFPIRQFFPEKVSLSNGKEIIKAFPLWWVNENISRTVTGTLVVADKGKTLKNNIALIHLPLKQQGPNQKKYIDSIINVGVKGIVAITDNPSGEIEAYNTNKDQQPWKVPIILIAPKDSTKALEFVKNGKAATLSINGTFKEVKGRNVYGTIGNGDQYIVISTPISGWFTCGGERGSGIAIWLSLAKWAAAQKSKYTFVFTGNSGHEHAFKGAHEYLEQNAPPVEKTHLWIHFGAGAATLEYKTTASGLVKQTNVDPKRRFFFNDLVKNSFNNAFAGIDAVKVLANENPGGELIYVAKKGYKRFAGVSYAHPFFHVKTDDATTTSPEILEETAKAFRDFIKEDIK
ncbi:hypothetical protein [Flavobacterium hydrophilum]|uniref:PA domain-containing protein n=1 Tax=Flavobacterium hydrophilum TaxID=2211445 RepID=A0A2V4CJW8_9FLAO|nr:hypothetical protein [Flavobacterium hydrophilum]PXY46144.1 hypothetical protein DMB68_02865 [Flavobacterium hydrophilum]